MAGDGGTAGWSVVSEGREGYIQLLAGRLRAEGLEVFVHRVPDQASLYEAGESKFQLLVPSAEAKAASAILQESPIPPEPDHGSDCSGSPVLEDGALEDLAAIFDAADRLMHNPWSEGASRDLDRGVDGVAHASPPYGLDPTVWAAAADLGSKLLAQIEAEEASEEISEEAGRLRGFLRPYI